MSNILSKRIKCPRCNHKFVTTSDKSFFRKLPNPYIRHCWRCDKVIPNNTSRRIFCSDKCKKTYRSKVMKQFEKFTKL